MIRNYGERMLRKKRPIDKIRRVLIIGFIISFFILCSYSFILLLPFYISPDVFIYFVTPFLVFSSGLIVLFLIHMTKKMKKYSTEATMINHFKKRAVILISINLGLIILFYTLILVNSDINVWIDQTLSLIINLLGWVVGVEFAVLSAFTAIKSIYNIKKNVIREGQSEKVILSYMRGSAVYFFLLVSIGSFFIISSLTLLFIFPFTTLIISSLIPYIIISIICSILFTYIYNMITKDKLLPKMNELLKFRDLVKNRESIQIRELQAFYKGDENFYKNMLKWVENFGFTIEDDVIILNEENLEEFIIELDISRKKWKSHEKKKEKKI